MIAWRPRRMKLLLEWPEPLHGPQTPENDWNLLLPFCETLKNAFEKMCSVHNIGLRETRTGNRCFTFFPCVEERSAEFEQIKDCLNILGSYVAIRDCLALSFALDYDREGGKPGNPRTTIGRLRKRAKTYGGPPTKDTFAAADELIQACLEGLQELTCYDSATCVVAMPPSDPEKGFDLPEYLAAGISRGLGKPDRSTAVLTTRKRPPSKSVALEKKLSAIDGTVSVAPDVFRNQIVLLVDDLYQSGVTMNYVAMLLLEAGAKKVFGLACEKTCRNDDNVNRH